MSDALLADLRALAEKWNRPGLTCEPWDDVSDDIRDLIAKHEPKPDARRATQHGEWCSCDALRGFPCKHAPKPDVSERDELARLLHQGTCEGRLFAHNASVTRCERAADVILTAGWRKR